MNYEHYEIEDNSFKYNGEKYDCSRAIKKDIKVILQEADNSHKDDFKRLYVRASLRPDKVRLFLDKNDNPMYGMIIYSVKYKEINVRRSACGNYYPISDSRELSPHPFQGRICW